MASVYAQKKMSKKLQDRHTKKELLRVAKSVNSKSSPALTKKEIADGIVKKRVVQLLFGFGLSVAAITGLMLAYYKRHKKPITTAAAKKATVQELREAANRYLRKKSPPPDRNIKKELQKELGSAFKTPGWL